MINGSNSPRLSFSKNVQNSNLAEMSDFNEPLSNMNIILYNSSNDVSRTQHFQALKHQELQKEGPKIYNFCKFSPKNYNNNLPSIFQVKTCK